MNISLFDNDSIMDLTGNSLAGDGQGNGSRSAAFIFDIPAPVDIVSGRLTAAGFTLTIEGTPGETYSVETATSLSGPWTNLGTASTTFTDPNPAGSRRFYRARSR